MEKLKAILKSNKTRTALWQIANGVIVILIVAIGEINYIYAPVLIAGLNFITKEINRNYL